MDFKIMSIGEKKIKSISERRQGSVVIGGLGLIAGVIFTYNRKQNIIIGGLAGMLLSVIAFDYYLDYGKEKKRRRRIEPSK